MDGSNSLVRASWDLKNLVFEVPLYYSTVLLSVPGKVSCVSIHGAKKSSSITLRWTCSWRSTNRARVETPANRIHCNLLIQLGTEE